MTETQKVLAGVTDLKRCALRPFLSAAWTRKTQAADTTMQVTSYGTDTSYMYDTVGSASSSSSSLNPKDNLLDLISNGVGKGYYTSSRATS
eukprot:6888-Heterococcus_DN1.PRE.1